MAEKSKKDVSPDQAFYDDEVLRSPAEHARWMREIEFYFDKYANRLNAVLAGSSGCIAELGAGSCGLSACLSRLANVKRVTALDISGKRMEKMIELSTSVLKGNKLKINPVVCDFNERLPFADGELDVILFDAALHHTRSMWNTLAECNRVLKPSGLLIAQRESYLSPFRAGRQISKLLNTSEIAAKVSENIYLLEQYKYYLFVSGFEVDFIGVEQNFMKKILFFMNGRGLFTDGVLFCKKNER